MQGTQEDSLEKEMATHSSNLAWEIPWTEEPGREQTMASQSWIQLSNNKQLPSESLQSNNQKRLDWTAFGVFWLKDQ